MKNIDFQSVLLNDPLYTEYNIMDYIYKDVFNLLLFHKNSEFCNENKSIDSFCIECSKDTTFLSNNSSFQGLENIFYNLQMNSPDDEPNINYLSNLETISTFQREFSCPRSPHDSSHSHIITFKIANGKIIKIGQFPSLANLAKVEIVKYKKLNNDIYTELNRAIGLASHGVGVGAFVYLRRILEKHIVNQKIDELIKEGHLAVQDTIKIDFKTKIKLVKDYLPNFLVDNPKIYSILSMGMHELDEGECKSVFPIIRTAIEIILDEKIEQIEKERKAKSIGLQLNKI